MTHRTQFLKRHGITEPNLSKISRASGVSVADLKEIDKRGRGAWKTNPESVRLKGSFKKDPTAPRSAKLSAEQWGMARLYAMVNKLDLIREGKQKRINQDCDIARKYIASIQCEK
jgi:hypothetical protein